MAMINLCTYDPRKVVGPIGMFHCPECGCMQLAGMEHLPCYPEDCWLANNDKENKEKREQ